MQSNSVGQGLYILSVLRDEIQKKDLIHQFPLRLGKICQYVPPSPPPPKKKKKKKGNPSTGCQNTILMIDGVFIVYIFF